MIRGGLESGDVEIDVFVLLPDSSVFLYLVLSLLPSFHCITCPFPYRCVGSNILVLILHFVSQFCLTCSFLSISFTPIFRFCSFFYFYDEFYLILSSRYK